MRFASFYTETNPTPRVGIVQGDEVLDVRRAAYALTLIGPEQMLDILDQYETAYEVIAKLMEKAEGKPFSEVSTFTNNRAVHTLSEVQLVAPIPRPRKNIMCLGLNYAEHAKESAEARGRPAAKLEYPVIFTKAPTTVNGPYSELVIDPSVSEKIDWEAELAVVIGKGGKNIREEEALEHVFGYTVLNDVTARDLQDRHKQFFKGKSIDGYCPMGPWIVTADEIADPQNLAIGLRLNGVIKQSSSTSTMIFSVRQIIAILSQGMTLEPGDLIAMGTPSGVGFARNPPEFLKAGDIVETEIEGIGMLRNTVVNVS